MALTTLGFTGVQASYTPIASKAESTISGSNAIRYRYAYRIGWALLIIWFNL